VKALALLLTVLAVSSSAYAKGHRSSGAYGGGINYVSPHVRTSTGAYVAPHYRTGSNSVKFDNWSTKGNVNPMTGKKGSKPSDFGYR
jgi:hypothetical protein